MSSAGEAGRRGEGGGRRGRKPGTRLLGRRGNGSGTDGRREAKGGSRIGVRGGRVQMGDG
ncbi:uncharacterized protein K444DRAFT_363837 [Hyaloscypha bicolor E]|uniref:Uncharacterized protein n=1 Tax=Hyaloscypha bicolor E TaxID=1095630 RepID=A0A2J6TDK8_9HELO|nr:uncharacterized protein K444DRAFT_363837 [Hyaloscypha bicolor E]PMD61111.1 hypothetical protein K444DRAFT_363837 [Hyaloscypha bicolor E]